MSHYEELDIALKKLKRMRNQFIIYVSVFISALLLFIFLFQVVFLQDFYEQSQKNNMEEIANFLAENIDDTNINDTIVNQARINNVCIRVLSNNDYKASAIVGCSINNLEADEITAYAQNAINNGGSNLEENHQSMIIKVGSYQDNETSNVIINDVNNLTYTKVIRYDTANPIIIMINSQVTPINSTVDTLRSQFVVIAFLSLVVTILLSFAISRRFIKPLELINDEAKNLALGEYDGDKINPGYTEAIELNQTLNAASDKINEVDKAKRDLIANVSHDLRTPLTMIKGYSEMMRDLPGENNEENAQIINDEASRLSALVTDLLDLSKLQDNKIEIKKEQVSMTKILHNVFHQYYHYCKSKNITLKLVAKKDYICLVDEKRIKQVLYNFINNAINYGAVDNLVITIKLTVFDNKCKVEIIDNGKGIEASKLKLIWDRYYKFNESHVRFLKGSGIGLAISKEILILHGFEFGVTSKVNEGSDFYFIINN